MMNGALGWATSSWPPAATLGPRNTARTSASGGNGGSPFGSTGACRKVLTIVAMSRGTVW